MDTKEPGLFSKQNNRVAAKGIMMGQIGLKLSSRIGYWLQQAIFLPTWGSVYFVGESLMAV